MNKRNMVIALFMGLISSILVILAAIPLANDSTAKHLENRLSELPLPEQTELIESIYADGKLTGNGNGMQYFGAILIKSELTLDELEAHYSQYSENEFDCIAEAQQSSEISQIENKQISFIYDVPSSENYFIVYSWGEKGGWFGELDIRGR